ncbi:MAG: hypothetical protein ABI082_08575 [Dokdonella sp.]
MKTPANEPWIDRSVALLEQSAQSLDAATLLRLNRARQAALAQRYAHRRGWAIGSGLAGATLAVLIAFGIGHRLHAPAGIKLDAAEHTMSDSVALTDDDSTDIYENLDFYVWLNAEQHGND